jgi:hypothetical protein
VFESGNTSTDHRVTVARVEKPGSNGSQSSSYHSI